MVRGCDLEREGNRRGELVLMLLISIYEYDFRSY
jgi:hypothetical protein